MHDNEYPVFWLLAVLDASCSCYYIGRHVRCLLKNDALHMVALLLPYRKLDVILREKSLCKKYPNSLHKHGTPDLT